MNTHDVMEVFKSTMHTFEKDCRDLDVIVRDEIVRSGLFRAIRHVFMK